MLLPEASCCTHDYHHVVCERGRRCLDSEHLAAIAGAGTFFIRTEHSPCERQQQGQAQEIYEAPFTKLRFPKGPAGCRSGKLLSERRLGSA